MRGTLDGAQRHAPAAAAAEGIPVFIDGRAFTMTLQLNQMGIDAFAYRVALDRLARLSDKASLNFMVPIESL
ncbi:MAG: hypothetical protein P8164_11460 [Gammaproteobacteria bacterium]